VLRPKPALLGFLETVVHHSASRPPELAARAGLRFVLGLVRGVISTPSIHEIHRRAPSLERDWWA